MQDYGALCKVIHMEATTTANESVALTPADRLAAARAEHAALAAWSASGRIDARPLTPNLDLIHHINSSGGTTTMTTTNTTTAPAAPALTFPVEIPVAWLDAWLEEPAAETADPNSAEPLERGRAALAAAVPTSATKKVRRFDLSIEALRALVNEAKWFTYYWGEQLAADDPDSRMAHMARGRSSATLHGKMEVVLAEAEAAVAAAAASAPAAPRGSGSFVTAEHPDGFTCRCCGEHLPVTSFPTITGPEVRGSRCRKCGAAARAAKAVRS